MSSLRWHHRPVLTDPVLVAAFEGWNDAGDAASGAARWLADEVGAELVATIEAEEFFDFTSTRPIVERLDDGRRRITWPDTELWAGTLDGERDVIVLVGHEPHLRWRTYCRAVLEVADELGVSMVLSLGALLSDIPHSRPTPVTGTSDDPSLLARLDLGRSTYEGPTGIVGVLHGACHDASLASASLWAAVPKYVAGAPSPPAALALVESMIAVLDFPTSTADLRGAADAYLRHIDDLVAADEDTAAFVASLEEAADEEDDGFDEDIDGFGEHDDFDDDPIDDPDERDDWVRNHSSGTLEGTNPAEFVEEVERFLRGD